MTPTALVLDGAMLPAAFVLGTLVFASGVIAVLAGTRFCLRHARGSWILAAVAVLAAVPVVLLWLDGRITRYFATSFWLVVVLGLPAGAGTVLRARAFGLATAAWVGVFAIVFASRIPLGVRIGSAAVIGFVVEAFAITFTMLPAVLVGAATASFVDERSDWNRGG